MKQTYFDCYLGHKQNWKKRFSIILRNLREIKLQSRFFEKRHFEKWARLTNIRLNNSVVQNINRDIFGIKRSDFTDNFTKKKFKKTQTL